MSPFTATTKDQFSIADSVYVIDSPVRSDLSFADPDAYQIKLHDHT